jgi:hypothetical protein
VGLLTFHGTDFSDAERCGKIMLTSTEVICSLTEEGIVIRAAWETSVSELQ